jgi:hypothetical protein
MGYSEKYFSGQVTEWLDNGWLQEGGTLIEFGAQEFYSDPIVTRREVSEFLLSRGKTDAQISEVMGISGLFPVANVYRSLGIDYTAIDVDRAHGSTYYDLNTFSTPSEWTGSFDFVNNEGTIEHLINPINGFHVSHELLKVGGVVRHSMPLSGWREHGFMYPTTKFYAQLVGENGYEVLQAYVEAGSEPTAFECPLFKSRASDFALTDVWMQLIYRKTSDKAFVFPSDHLITPDASIIAQRLAQNLTTYSLARLHRDVADEIKPRESKY